MATVVSGNETAQTAPVATRPGSPAEPGGGSLDQIGATGSGPNGSIEPLSAKGIATRTAIIDAALRLFRDQGYDGTTMRAIAAEAGVSLGNAYYYFSSKEHLIQGFYDRAGDEQRIAAQAFLANGPTSLEERLVGVHEVWIDVMEPYRAFAGSFFRNAADPSSPLSPFSAASAPARQRAIGLISEVVDGSDTSPPKAIRDELPELLWIYFMGIVLFWVHDPSENSARTRVLNQRTAPMIVRAIQLSKLPMVKGMVQEIVDLIAELKSL